MTVCEVAASFDDYDPETLSIKCPECHAAATAKCLGPKPGGMGGATWLPAPHRARVLAAHDRQEDSIWG
jgi:hypothetical protein